MALNIDGQIGEQKAIAFFKAKGMHCFQSDLIVLDFKGKYFMVEVKYQEAFEPPPFAGHGLPPYQVKARLAFYQKTGIRCLFMVFDKNDKDIYYNWLDELNAGNQFLTSTKSRVIFDINEFVRISA